MTESQETYVTPYSCRYTGWRAVREEYEKRRMHCIDRQAAITNRNAQRQHEDVHANKTHLLTTSFLRGKPQPFHIHYRCSVFCKQQSCPVWGKEMGMFFQGTSVNTWQNAQLKLLETEPSNNTRWLYNGSFVWVFGEIFAPQTDH